MAKLELLSAYLEILDLDNPSLDDIYTESMDDFIKRNHITDDDWYEVQDKVMFAPVTDTVLELMKRYNITADKIGKCWMILIDRTGSTRDYKTIALSKFWDELEDKELVPHFCYNETIDEYRR